MRKTTNLQLDIPGTDLSITVKQGTADQDPYDIAQSYIRVYGDKALQAAVKDNLDGSLTDIILFDGCAYPVKAVFYQITNWKDVW